MHACNSWNMNKTANSNGKACLPSFCILSALDRSTLVMEVIGSLVTITQLTDYTFRTIKSIKECYYQIRKQSAKLRQQLSHIERLDLAVKEIKDKPLRSSLVEANLRVIAQTTTQIKEVLELALSKQKTRLFVRFLRASVQQSHQIRLVELFSDLEREKTSLLLGIANSQRDISNRIYQRLIKPARMDEGQKPCLNCVR